MPVPPPKIDHLRTAARRCLLALPDGELEALRPAIAALVQSYHRLDELASHSPPRCHPRDRGRPPNPAENPLNAWAWRCSIQRNVDGPLAGMRVAIKDNICVAGLPLRNGAQMLDYTPEQDAAVVARLLDAGAEITGKAACEHLCMSGGSHTSDFGPVRNPHDATRSAGGSTSGGAALVVAGECDVAIGTDTAGSLRLPAAWCGAYGLKPTFGLVPFTGIFPMEPSLDHAGPIAANVANVAKVLEAIAGDDGLDPRQIGAPAVAYSRLLTGDIRGQRIGILEEGFGLPESEPDVDEAVREAALLFSKLGAKLRPVSVPLHTSGRDIFLPIAVEGSAAQLLRGNGMANWKGGHTPEMLNALARALVDGGETLADTVKVVVLAGQYLQDATFGRYYALAQNLSRRLSAAYDDALRGVDLLLLPTAPMKATPLPLPGAARDEIIARAFENSANTSPFDVSGHPAMNVPCALSGGLPVGMMIVGRRGEDLTVLQVARAFETTGCYAAATGPNLAP